MEMDWSICIAQWELIKKKYALPMLCVLKNSTPARNFSGNIKKINITHNERNPDEESVVVTMDVDNGKKDTEITITKENLFVIGGGRDAEGNPVFSSKEFNE